MRALPASGLAFVLVLAVLAVGVAACGGGGGGGAGTDTWRSALFPADWTPAFADAEGRRLPDTSYAGYHQGERLLPDGQTPAAWDVVADFGADPTGATDATAAFQAALDAEPAGVVHVPAGLYRCDGLLVVDQSGVVLRGAGRTVSRVYFTRHDAMTGRAHLTFRGALVREADLPLAVDAAPLQTTVQVVDAGDLAAGDDVILGWTITPAFVDEHGMTGTWQAFNDTWQPFLRREVVSVDRASSPHVVELDVPLRYPARVRDGASLRREGGYLQEVGVEALGLANAVAWDGAWANERTHVLAFDAVEDGWIRDVTSFVPPTSPTEGYGAGDHLQNGGIIVSRSKRVTIADCRMERAQNRGGGGCGYLFEIRVSNEILTRDCEGFAGRHNFIQNWGFGVTGCVWLRCHTADGFAISTMAFPTIGQVGHSEFHHSLATANLVDGVRIDDGWSSINRHDWSTGAGHTATGNVFWNVTGGGELRSMQFGWGYVIGTGEGLRVDVSTGGSAGEGTDPPDWTEGLGRAGSLEPVSLYAEQFRRRVGRDPE